MLAKSQRLNLKKSFKWVAAGKKIETPLFKIFFRNGENRFPLVGIANSKNQFRKANKRNRARRVVSQAIQDIYPNLKEDLNLVIMPKSILLEKSVEDVKKGLEDVKAIYRTD